MSGESTRWTPRLRLLNGGLDFEIQQRGSVLRVTLSGVLDRSCLLRLRKRLDPLLVRRDCRLILDGRRLTHLDYRAAAKLIAWHRELHLFGHELWLLGWNHYLKTILALGDSALVEPGPVEAHSHNRVSAS